MWPRLALTLLWRRRWSWTSEVLISAPCPQSTGVTGMSPHDVLLLKSMPTLTAAFQGWLPSFFLTVFQTFYFYAILFFLTLCNLVIVCFLVSFFSPPPTSSLNDLRLLSDLYLWIYNFYPILKILQYHFFESFFCPSSPSSNRTQSQGLLLCFSAFPFPDALFII